MSVEQFLQDLNLPVNSGLDAVEEKFLSAVKERIRKTAESYDEAAVAEEDRGLREFHRLFFDYSLDWAAKEAARHKDAPANPGAARIKQEARQLIESVHGLITEFALCYMHINRFTTLLRDEIRNEEIRIGSPGHKNIRWTADAGVVIGRYKKQKREMLEQNVRMRASREALEQLEKEIAAVRQSMTALSGNEAGETFTRLLIGSLRNADFEKAEKTLKSVDSAKKKFGLGGDSAAALQDAVKKAAAQAVLLAARNRDNIASTEGKLYLRVIETETAFNGNIQELRKIKQFLAKYHLPYMEYKLDMLSHLKEKLMVVGSLDSLMLMYKKLLTGLVTPMTDIKDIREYESAVVGMAKHLVSGLYAEIPKIFQRARETVQEFRENTDEFRETEKLELAEIPVGGEACAVSG